MSGHGACSRAQPGFRTLAEALTFLETAVTRRRLHSDDAQRVPGLLCREGTIAVALHAKLRTSPDTWKQLKQLVLQ